MQMIESGRSVIMGNSRGEFSDGFKGREGDH